MCQNLCAEPNHMASLKVHGKDREEEMQTLDYVIVDTANDVVAYLLASHLTEGSSMPTCAFLLLYVIFLVGGSKCNFSVTGI